MKPKASREWCSATRGFHGSHKVIGNLVWKEPQKVSSPTSCQEQDFFLAQIRLVRALSCWGSKAFNDGDGTASLCPGSTAELSSQGKSFSLYPAWALFVSTCAHFLLTSHHAERQRTWVYLLNHFPVGAGRMLLLGHSQKEKLQNLTNRRLDCCFNVIVK